MKFLKIKIFTIAIFSLLFFSIDTIDAAQLSIESSVSEIKVGEIVNFTVFVNSNNESINNIEGQIEVSRDLLEIQSVNSAGSIINLWVEQPVQTSNGVSFNGGITNPGYTGARGKAISFSAKALKSGTASIIFKSGSVRANDGLGTDVLNNKINSSVSIISLPVVVPVPKIEPVVEVSEEDNTPAPNAPKINSSLSPDSAVWYKQNSTTFSWDLPRDAIAVRTLFDKNPFSEPSVIYNPVIYSKKIENIEDGVWFFHLQYKTPSGWSKIGHKEIRVDTTAPKEPVVTYEVTDSNLVKLSIDGEDDTSGLEKYVLSTKDKENIDLTDIQKDGSINFVFPFDYVDTKIIQINSIDRAGNTYQSSIVINFPLNNKNQELLSVKEKGSKFEFKAWANKINNIPSLILLIIITLLIVFFRKRFFMSDEDERKNRIEKIEKDTITLLDSLKENVLEDISLFKVDRNVKNTDEAEDVLLKNLLQDFKTVEKVISTRLKKNKGEKKETKQPKE